MARVSRNTKTAFVLQDDYRSLAAVVIDGRVGIKTDRRHAKPSASQCRKLAKWLNDRADEMEAKQ